METTIMRLGFRRNGKDNGNYYHGMYRNYFKDPVLHSQLTKDKAHELPQVQVRTWEVRKWST